jgi:endonuclease/exonuclease/phosphatase family metal-dependent hydrolase
MKRIYRSVLLVLFLGLTGTVLYFLIDATIHDYKPVADEVIQCEGNVQHEIVADTLSFAIWNVGYAGLGSTMDFFYDGGHRVRPEEGYFELCQREILDRIASMGGTDFILLQEVDQRAKRSYFNNQVELIKTQLPEYCAAFASNYRVKFVPVPIGRSMGSVHSGLMTLGRYTPDSTLRIQLPGRFSWPKRLFMLDRCVMVSRYPTQQGNDLVVINLHNSAFDETGQLRKEELARIRTIMTVAYEQGHYVIAGGDWNMNPPGFDPGMITTDSVFRETHGVLPDFLPADWQWVWDPVIPTNRDVSSAYQKMITGTTILDFFLVSPNVEVLEVKATHLDFLSSDHHPVFLKVFLKPGL